MYEKRRICINQFPLFCKDIYRCFLILTGKSRGFFQCDRLECKTYLADTAVNSFNPLPNKPWFLRVCNISILKTLWEKEKLLVTNNFSFSHSVFFLFRELSAIFIEFKIVVCKLFHIWKSLKFVFWERGKLQLFPRR